MLELLLIAQAVGPGYVGLPRQDFDYQICLNNPGRGSYVNFRKHPTTLASTKGRLTHGTPVKIVDRMEGPDDGMWWARVITYKGENGFVRDDYVCVR